MRRLGLALPAAALCAAVGVAPPATGQQSAAIQKHCWEPISPLCMNQQSTYDGSRMQQSCDDQVEEFRRGMTQYATCLEERANLVRSMRDATVERHQCLKDGGTDCGDSS